MFKKVLFVAAVLLLLTNFGFADALQSVDVWPNSLIGEWKGTIRSSNCNGAGCDTKVDSIITRGPDGRLTDNELNILDPSTYEQEVYKEIQTLDGVNNYYYCFRWTGTDVYVVENCYRIIDNNHLYLLYFGGKFGIEGASGGVLTRVGTLTQDSALGCEPANGMVQYGIINIGPDVFVILCGQRWLVPNPITLDALSISRDMIDNMGLDDADLLAIPKSIVDIPDINRDPVGFQNFLNEHGQELENMNIHARSQDMSSQPVATPAPLVEKPAVTSEEPFYCSWWVIGWLACDLAEANSAQAWCEPQCMTLMRDKDHRPDMNLWSRGTGDSSPLDVLANAEKETPYNDPPKTGPLMQIRVRESTEQSEAGDLIIWQAGCGGASDVGHIGEVVSSVGITVNINDANWDKKCSERKDVQIQILSCMRFVTKPFPAGTYVPTVQPAVINCDDYQGWQNFACNYIPWWKP